MSIDSSADQAGGIVLNSFQNTLKKEYIRRMLLYSSCQQRDH